MNYIPLPSEPCGNELAYVAVLVIFVIASYIGYLSVKNVKGTK